MPSRFENIFMIDLKETLYQQRSHSKHFMQTLMNLSGHNLCSLDKKQSLFFAYNQNGSATRNQCDTRQAVLNLYKRRFKGLYGSA